MSRPQWITAAAAVAELQRTGISDPGALGIWAHDGLLRARAIVERIAGRVEHDTPSHEFVPRWFWGRLRNDMVIAEWEAGIFETTADYDHEFGTQETTWRISGVEFSATDIARQLHGGASAKTVDAHHRIFAPSSPTTSETVGELIPEAVEKESKIAEIAVINQRGTLPPSAKPSNYKYEEPSHRAATIIRDENVSLAAAIRRAVPEHNNSAVQPASVAAAIRRAFDLMYDKKGLPLKN